MNTVLFILGATLFNILVTVAAFMLLLTAYAHLLMRRLPESVHPWAIPLFFIASIATSFLVYRLTLNFLVKKIDMDRYFDPIFNSRHRR
jgi:hypothetical protein